MSACECGGPAMWADVLAVSSPKVFNVDGFKREGVAGDMSIPIDDSIVRSIFIEGPTFEGRATRSFAWIGVPKHASATNKVPAMVLIHGGGATAYAGWVQMWVNRGYAAIAMDTCGQLPIGEYDKWQRHDHSGPAGWGGMDQIDRPVRDQWSFQAVSSVILAHTVLRSQPEVDAAHIGVTGISWGGYLTCMVAGADPRFAFAAPVYGCGYLGENSVWLGDYEKMGRERAERWLAMWDPSVLLPHVKCPMVWVNGTNDFAFPMDSWQKSSRLPKSPRVLSMIVRMPHGHGWVGERPVEIFTMAESIAFGRPPLACVGQPKMSGRTMTVRFESATPIVRATLNFTTSREKWADRDWQTVPATIDVSTNCAAGDVPNDASVAYINVIDAVGNVVSSEHVIL